MKTTLIIIAAFFAIELAALIIGLIRHGCKEIEDKMPHKTIKREIDNPVKGQPFLYRKTELYKYWSKHKTHKLC